MLYRFSITVCYSLFKIFFRLKISGQEAFSCKKPFILASNHLSYLDPPVLAVCLPCKITFLAKEELFRKPLAAWYFKDVGVIPIKRGKNDISNTRLALKTLKTKPLLIFPQGTRGASLDEASSGVGFLCKRAKVPVIAAKISGTDQVLPKGARSLSCGRIEVIFKPVEGINQSDSYEDITKKVVATIKSL
ncbi:MAG: 1-acyl-sn-glycerol-3-phosphate acyltransferase [Candidatus Omnitrophica bacterium]|nr:1-acyl-sn-glycerol-3-phosphate acyltransferase [Candidatus Omnitrophota bacterium]MBU2044360.1 1-acyl-sn-glycerol-3-phosphate acyltransferase [Candidatus Omnitrophota bacterium]MBU2265767.1 1-acyl-sn-glycerol-3-phosphate acyltransferase [Candidatus Omnitrophota bacterium]MBU2473795.1 1-acyl-sn-glycerol-3-phosphate acyltransferase [Candidatus Omnitrophota bacterium]